MTMKDLAQLEIQAVINQINISNQALLRALGVEEEGDDGSGVCDMCAGCPNCMEEGEERVHYWSDLANLTHATQVEEFGFCTCEEQEQFPYDDCPRQVK